MGFANDLGFGGMVMANLYAYKATQPKDLFKASDPVGPENDGYLYRLSNTGLTLVAGWGNHGHTAERVKFLNDWGLKALRINQSGAPAHPLYLPKGLPLVHYRPIF